MRDYTLHFLDNDGNIIVPDKPVAQVPTKGLLFALEKLNAGTFKNGGTQCTNEQLAERIRIELVARSLT
jgi:hypothetical protein